MPDLVLDELKDALDGCGVEAYTLDTVKKRLVIGNREDFDSFIDYFEKKIGKPVDARTADPRGNAPYGQVCTAWFDYKGWHIKGFINIHKEKK